MFTALFTSRIDRSERLAGGNAGCRNGSVIYRSQYAHIKGGAVLADLFGKQVIFKRLHQMSIKSFQLKNGRASFFCQKLHQSVSGSLIVLGGLDFPLPFLV